jgi:ADP-heptose:LPS heptosyltransferase
VKILVIRRDNIGDLVCTTPLFAALRRRYPDAHLAALVNSYNAAVLDGNPDLDAVYAYTKLKHRAPGESTMRIVLDKLRLFARLRRERFDHVVLAKSGFDRQGLALARPLGAARITGFAPAAGAAPRALTQALAHPANDELHEVEVMMLLAAALDARDAPGPLRVFPSSQEVAKWRARLPPGVQRWVAVHISARDPRRIWPVEKFVELIRSLGAGVVLLWSPGAADNPRHPGDDARAAAIASRAGPGVALLPARTERLEDLVAALSLCETFIGVDGGAMHVAAGLGLRVIALFENLPYKRRHWHPWQVPHEMVWPETLDIADIPVERVTQAFARLAQRR